MCLINARKWYYVCWQAHLTGSGVNRGHGCLSHFLTRVHAIITKYFSQRHAFHHEDIVIFSNWKCSLPVNELGCKDKSNKSGHPIKERGKFPFWYPFSFSFVKEHSSWNEIKGFIYLFLTTRTNLVPCIMQIWQCRFIKNQPVRLTILITSEFSMTKTISEQLKA